MAKKKTFDPDALERAGQDIVKKHQLRENIKPAETIEKEVSEVVRKSKKETEKTQLCRVGISFHRRVKMAAIRQDMTIRQFLEKLIADNTPEV